MTWTCRGIGPLRGMLVAGVAVLHVMLLCCMVCHCDWIVLVAIACHFQWFSVSCIVWHVHVLYVMIYIGTVYVIACHVSV